MNRVLALLMTALLPSLAHAEGIPTLTSWHLQLNGALKTPDRHVYDIDLFDTPAETIADLKQQGRVVICYFSAGSFEDWRTDAESFPAEVKGLPLEGWVGESWLDVRDPRVLEIMKTRMALAVSKGCDGVDPDNVDGFQNSTGFPLTAADQLAYNKSLALAAHGQGLLVGLKNALDLVSKLAPYYDFAVNESCYTYKECGLLQPFVRYGRPVFIAEYRAYNATLCAAAQRSGYNLQFYKLALQNVGTPCPTQ
jgi:hypothetical protein